MLNAQILQQFEDRIAKMQKRKPAEVIVGNFPKGLENIVSMYERDNHQIIMNNAVIPKVNDVELVATILHEGRHAYQWIQINNPDKSKESKELLKKWKDEFLNYEQELANQNDPKYLNLAIEVDAVAYAALNIYNMTKLQLSIDPKMKELVLQRQVEIKKTEDIF
ncbi:MAG: hypothetical protein RQ856_01705 [Candidatus Izemoplasmatales bacterium]|nr:hypothetical protein [Candidatus Izemoplasmatales bacterium]